MVNEPVKIYGTNTASFHLAISKVESDNVYLLWDSGNKGVLHGLFVLIAQREGYEISTKEMDGKIYYSLPWSKELEKQFTSLIEDLLNIKLSVPGALEVCFQMQLPLGIANDK